MLLNPFWFYLVLPVFWKQHVQARVLTHTHTHTHLHILKWSVFLMGQYGISPERFEDNLHLSSFFKILTTSADGDNQVLNTTRLFLYYTDLTLYIIISPRSSLNLVVMFISGLCLHSTRTQLSCDCLSMASRGNFISCFQWSCYMWSFTYLHDYKNLIVGTGSLSMLFIHEFSQIFDYERFWISLMRRLGK